MQGTQGMILNAAGPNSQALLGAKRGWSLTLRGISLQACKADAGGDGREAFTVWARLEP